MARKARGEITRWRRLLGRLAPEAVADESTLTEARQRIARLEAEVSELRSQLDAPGEAGDTTTAPDLPMSASEALTRLVTDHSPDLITVHNRDNNYIFVSPNYERFLGWKTRELIGSNRFDFFHDDDRRQFDPDAEESTQAAELTHVNLGESVRYRMLTPSGQYRWMESRTRRTEDGLYWVSMTRDIHAQILAAEERTSMSDELRRLAYTDALTGLPNRLAADERLQREFARSRERSEALSVAIIDIDKFKHINDTLGHQAGDSVLKHVAAVIRDGKRDADFAARWAGDEFILVQPKTAVDQALHALERLRAHTASEINGVTLSIGVAETGDPGNVDELLQRADDAMYAAKNAGRDRVEIYTPPASTSETSDNQQEPS